jgi:hypothetical protein
MALGLASKARVYKVQLKMSLGVNFMLLRVQENVRE